MSQYSNARAMRALIKASLQSILKSPSAIVFSIAFPLIFILVFGFLGSGGGHGSLKVATAPNSDTANELYRILHKIPELKWVGGDSAFIAKQLNEGELAASIAITPHTDTALPQYSIMLHTPSSQMANVQQLKAIIHTVVQTMDPEIATRSAKLALIQVQESKVREFRMIDFILPGQLGFSLLAGSVFGTAFVFFNLRQTLVLKRFFATPVRKEFIVLSEGISRMIFQLMGASIIIAVGHFAFGYTLVNGFVTYVELITLSALAILVFMGFGFIVSGIAKSDATIPPFANMITLPQFLLAGTFFSIDNFPTWLQPFCKVLPLTFLNDAMRKVAFEGANLWDVRIDILLLLLWGTVLYVVAARVFKWE
jgi:ABC-2 type transport system permease protein